MFRSIHTIFIKFLPSLLLVFSPTSVLAVQAHGGPEGLVSHQIGHFLFITGMAFLLFWTRRNRCVGPGWPEFRIFLWLIICWNLLTFTGHWLNEHIDPVKFIKTNGTTIAFTAENFVDYIFFLSRLDHLLLLPAFIFLFLAIRKWGHDPGPVRISP